MAQPPPMAADGEHPARPYDELIAEYEALQRWYSAQLEFSQLLLSQWQAAAKAWATYAQASDDAALAARRRAVAERYRHEAAAQQTWQDRYERQCQEVATCLASLRRRAALRRRWSNPEDADLAAAVAEAWPDPAPTPLIGACGAS